MTKIMKGGVAYNSTSNIVALTQAEYNALSTAQKNNGNFYCITDADPSYFSAENIDYDNTDSGLSAINIQDAIDEVVGDIPDNATELPITSGSSTDTKGYIDSELAKKTTMYSTSLKYVSSGTTTTFTLPTYGNGFILLLGDGNNKPILGILAIHEGQANPTWFTNLGSSNCSVAVSGSTLTVTIPQWGSVQAFSNLPVT